VPAHGRTRSGIAAVLLALAALALASPAGAGDTAWAQTVVRDINAPFGIDLSLSGNPFESNVRIPLLGRPDGAGGSLTPYVSAGATDPTRSLDTSRVLPRRDIEANRTSQRTDVGAGLNWNLTDRLQLFGEMGFQRAREQSYSLFGLEGNRDGSYVKGGVTIRVP
jgi:hypothetical protein